MASRKAEVAALAIRILGPVLGGQEPPKWSDTFLTVGRLHEYTVRLQFEELSLHGYGPNGWVRCSLRKAAGGSRTLIRHADGRFEFERGPGGIGRTFTSDFEYRSPVEMEKALTEIAGALAAWSPEAGQDDEDEE